MAPEAALIVIPPGGEIRLNVSVLVGRSGSVAEADTASVVSSFKVWSAGTVNTGALLTSLTTTLKLLVPLSGGKPLSVTTVVRVFVLGPWASVGSQVIRPLVLIFAPAGGFTRL